MQADEDPIENSDFSFVQTYPEMSMLVEEIQGYTNNDKVVCVTGI